MFPPMRIPILLLLAVAAPSAAAAQTTRAERTDYRETSSHADVLAFLDSLQTSGAAIRVGTLGQSPEGRRIPYVIASRPLVARPADAHRSGKPIIYIQGNIHAGEVEGKEAAQMLLRDLTLGSLRPLLDSVILIVVPIYNVDGNEALAPGSRNRPGQNGPDTVGRRANGQGLDLNRDYVKMEAPETRGSMALLDAWDPDLFLDLHTTNGSYHGYALTYSPGLNPNSTPANDYVRERFLPTIRERMRRRHQQETFWYGNFRNQTPDSLVQGWETYEATPRFGSNWMGMRGRLSILSEAYSNADFPTRVSATYNFVREVLSLAAEQRTTIKSLIVAGARRSADSVGVRSRLAPPTRQDVIAELTEPADDGAGPFARRQRTGAFRTIRMPVFDRFVAVRKEARPAAYLIPATLDTLVTLLRRQGVTVERLARGWSGEVEAFAIDSVVPGRGRFEGHIATRLAGQWGAARAGKADAGWFVVRTDGPLGSFAAYLLEPASEDGFVTWNFLDRELRAGGEHPILRVRRPLATETEEVK
jgi:hypothetical protein